LSWDGDDQRVVIEAFPVDDDTAGSGGPPAEDPPTAGPGAEPLAGTEIDPDLGLDPDADVEAESAATEVFLVRLPPPAARGFASRAETVVSAGRPPCPFCGQPLDPDGHLCPRANGFKRVSV
jgi:hypothetical protein